MAEWDRQPDETARAYDVFRNGYLAQERGKRTLAGAARYAYGDKGIRDNGAPQGRIREWFKQHAWEDRERFYDAHLDKIAQKIDEQAVRDMHKRHAEAAELVQKTLLAPAMALAHKLQSDPSARNLFADDFPVDQLVRLVDRAGRGIDRLGRFERLVRGISDRLEITGAGGGPIEVEMTVERACIVLAPYLGVDPGEVPQVIADRRRQLREAEREQDAG